MNNAGASSAAPFATASDSLTGYDLADVEVVLFSPVQNTRRVIRDAIHGAGFRKLNVVMSTEKLRAYRALWDEDGLMLLEDAK